ncbi:hypothetical protein [Acinetobacter sp. ANC 5502]
MIFTLVVVLWALEVKSLRLPNNEFGAGFKLWDSIDRSLSHIQVIAQHQFRSQCPCDLEV